MERGRSQSFKTARVLNPEADIGEILSCLGLVMHAWRHSQDASSLPVPCCHLRRAVLEHPVDLLGHALLHLGVVRKKSACPPEQDG